MLLMVLIAGLDSRLLTTFPPWLAGISTQNLHNHLTFLRNMKLAKNKYQCRARRGVKYKSTTTVKFHDTYNVIESLD